MAEVGWMQDSSVAEGVAAAETHLKAGRPLEAVQTCRAILQRQPAQFDAHYLLGLALLQAGQVKEGEQWLNKACALEPAILDCAHMDALLRQRGQYSAFRSAVQRYREFKALQSTDAFIISYPKCGRTWLRLMLGKFLQLQFGLAEDTPLLELHALTSRLPGLPKVELTHDDHPQWKGAAGIERSKTRYRGKKVVFLARDPRDALVSYYFEYARRRSKQLANDAGFNGTVSEFVRHPIGGADSLTTFYNVWADQRAVPAAFQLLRYEDLHAAPVPTLRGLLEFLEFPHADDAMLERVVSYCSFQNMQRMERDNALNSIRLAAADPNDPDSFKVRKGKVGGYGDYLTADDLAYVNAKTAALDDLYRDYKQSPL